MRNDHAHLYFDAFDASDADRVDRILELLAAERPPLRFHRLHDRRVGPHALPMLELHFDPRDREAAVGWLDSRRDGLSVLVHADTGDDFRDHTQDVLWLGRPLPIDFGFFRLVADRPELALHQAVTRAR